MSDWRDFEEGLAEELGLERVPGSGNQWTHKLDIAGMGTRWSLKFTTALNFTVSWGMLREALEATEGPGGTGEMPVWAVRLLDDQHDFIIFRKEDVIRLFREEVKFIRPKSEKVEAKMRRAAVPELLREEDDDADD